MVKQKSIEEKFKKLNEVEHVLLRPGRYIGSITPHTEVAYVYNSVAKRMVKEEVTYNPGFLKLFDEVISNSIDHSKRPEGKGLDIIRVEFDQAKGEISIYDNGGIPVLKHHFEFVFAITCFNYKLIRENISKSSTLTILTSQH